MTSVQEQKDGLIVITMTKQELLCLQNRLIDPTHSDPGPITSAAVNEFLSIEYIYRGL